MLHGIHVQPNSTVFIISLNFSQNPSTRSCFNRKTMSMPPECAAQPPSPAFFFGFRGRMKMKCSPEPIDKRNNTITLTDNLEGKQFTKNVKLRLWKKETELRDTDGRCWIFAYDQHSQSLPSTSESCRQHVHKYIPIPERK
jgi:hypothetical protein